MTYIFSLVRVNLHGLTEKYNFTILVYDEIFSDLTLVTARKKRLKEWTRLSKIDLIVKMNPHWRDLYQDIVQ